MRAVTDLEDHNALRCSQSVSSAHDQDGIAFLEGRARHDVVRIIEQRNFTVALPDQKEFRSPLRTARWVPMTRYLVTCRSHHMTNLKIQLVRSDEASGSRELVSP